MSSAENDLYEVLMSHDRQVLQDYEKAYEYKPRVYGPCQRSAFARYFNSEFHRDTDGNFVRGERGVVSYNALYMYTLFFYAMEAEDRPWSQADIMYLSNCDRESVDREDTVERVAERTTDAAIVDYSV